MKIADKNAFEMTHKMTKNDRTYIMNGCYNIKIKKKLFWGEIYQKFSFNFILTETFEGSSVEPNTLDKVVRIGQTVQGLATKRCHDSQHNDTQHKEGTYMQHSAQARLCHYAECHSLFVILLYVIIPSVVMLNIVIQRVSMLSVIAPNKTAKLKVENLVKVYSTTSPLPFI